MRVLETGLVTLLFCTMAACTEQDAIVAAVPGTDASADVDAMPVEAERASGFASFSIPLPAERHYEVGEGIIGDTVTGLTWQAHVDDVARTWAEADAYCKARGQRLPSRVEMLSIVIPGLVPASDPLFDAPKEYHWTASQVGADPELGYVIYFGSHELGRASRFTRARVRCVTGEVRETERVVRGDVLEDHGTGLHWERAEGARCEYEEAIARCDALTLDGHDDWRLPSLAELSSTVDERIGAVSPAELTVTGAILWTHSTDESGYGNWPLDPTTGTVLPGSTQAMRAVRCVRRDRAL